MLEPWDDDDALWEKTVESKYHWKHQSVNGKAWAGTAHPSPPAESFTSCEYSSLICGVARSAIGRTKGLPSSAPKVPCLKAGSVLVPCTSDQ